MKRKPVIPLLREEDPARVLQQTVDVLNHGTKANPRMTAANHQRLLRAVGAWKESVRAWKESAKAWNDASRDPSKIPGPPRMLVPLEDRMTLGDVKGVFEWHLSPPNGSGRAYVSLSPTGENFRDVAAFYFGRLIMSSGCEKLGGPCLKCGLYYIKQSLRNSVFCSRKCAGGAVQSRIRKKEHIEKLSRAMRAIKNYRTRPSRFVDLGWKDWVAQAESDITPKFLSRAVTQGELRPPSKAHLPKSCG